MVLILTLNTIYAMIILNNLVNIVQSMEQEKTHKHLWKITGRKDSTLFFIRPILKEQLDLLENKNKIKNNQGWPQYKKLFMQVQKTEMYCN